jgi:hypothetical protein
MNLSIPHPTTATLSRNPVTSQLAANNITGPAKGSQHSAINVSNSGTLISTSTTQGLLNLGMMAFGKSTIDEWSSKGVDVSEKSLIAAAKALQDGFKLIVDKQGTKTAGSSVSINKHQIVINQMQQVPEWFSNEYDTALTMLDDPAHQKAFSKGALFFASLPAATDHGPSLYQAVAQYR